MKGELAQTPGSPAQALWEGWGLGRGSRISGVLPEAGLAMGPMDLETHPGVILLLFLRIIVICEHSYHLAKQEGG